MLDTYLTEDQNITIIEKENDDLFLDLIKERPCLYKKSSKDYHDKLVVENAMEEIAFILNDSVGNCEKKWQSFKQAYTKEKSLQELESRSGAGASTRKKWIHYNRMKELFSMDSSRHSYSNLSTNTTKEKNIVENKPSWKNKRKAANTVDSALKPYIQAAISKAYECQNIQENEKPPKDTVDVLTGKMIVARLNEMSPVSAKEKRKLIMKCLIDSDSESDC